MNNFDIDKYINTQKSSNNINLDDFPEIDLYMDQVIQLFERKLSYTKRNEEDKILTKTMINNYAKGNLLMKIKNKKYTKEHMILIGLIYNLKGALSLTDIKTMFDPIIEAFSKDEDYPLYDIYEAFLKIYDSNLENLSTSSKDIYNHVQELIANTDGRLGDFEEKFLLVCAYVSMSNLYRRMSEKIIDECLSDLKGGK